MKPQGEAEGRVVNLSEWGKLPVKQQWSTILEEEILQRIQEPCYHYPAWVTMLTGRTYTVEQMQRSHDRAKEWNKLGMELIEVIRRWAEER